MLINRHNNHKVTMSLYQHTYQHSIEQPDTFWASRAPFVGISKLGHLTWPVIREKVDEIFLVKDPGTTPL